MLSLSLLTYRVVFTRTALQTYIAHSLARLARIQPGMVVVDPMCGGGTIAIEAALAYPGTYPLHTGQSTEIKLTGAHYLCGDSYAPVVADAWRNIVGVPAIAGRVQALQWDSAQLPLSMPPLSRSSRVVPSLIFSRMQRMHPWIVSSVTCRGGVAQGRSARTRSSIPRCSRSGAEFSAPTAACLPSHSRRYGLNLAWDP
jgi:hypothetical protein